uniref:Uncharacterized protein n=1 Tax=Oryza meridionalis TaxID=40149 RepID=A0A0E0DK45_9ORYZ
MATREVSSAQELRRVIWKWDHVKELRIKINPNISLDEAHELWSAVSTVSGYARLYNLHILVAKDDARTLVLQKIHHLQKWAQDVERQLGVLQARIDALDEMLLGAGPTLPRGYQPIFYLGMAVGRVGHGQSDSMPDPRPTNPRP